MSLIAIESTGSFSSENTGRFLYPILHFLFKVDPFQFLHWHFYLRKSGHVIGYAVLSILCFRAWRVTIRVPGTPRWSIVWARIAFFMTALVASLDEWHQSYLPSRTGNVHDIVLDNTAAFAAQILLFLLLKGWRTTKPAPAPGRSLPRSEERVEPRTSRPFGP